MTKPWYHLMWSHSSQLFLLKKPVNISEKSSMKTPLQNQNQNSVYKQIHGCAMGSPVSPVFANHCMEIIEESAISASATPPRVWKRYVDDSFVIIEKTTVSTFHDTLNSIDPKISFTIDTENNGQISFLDTLVSRKDGVVTIDVYRKSTHTDRSLDFYSHHEKKHKISTASTLLNRASNLPSTSAGK